MTPLHIRLLLHCYAYAEQFEFINATMIEFRGDLERAGLIKPVDGVDYWQTTERGAAHVHQILNLPLPVQQWVTIDGKAIKCP